jgi:hypothetical protein
MDITKDFQNLLSKLHQKFQMVGSTRDNKKSQTNIKLKDKYDTYLLTLKDNGDLIYTNDNIKLGNLYQDQEGLIARLQESKLNEMSMTGGNASFTPGTGANTATPFAFKRKKKKKRNPYKLTNLMNESLTYSKFKNEVSTRTKQQQLHKSVKEVQKRLNEINKVLEFTNRMRNELNENGKEIEFSRFTEQSLKQIKEMTVNLYKNLKELKK